MNFVVGADAEVISASAFFVLYDRPGPYTANTEIPLCQCIMAERYFLLWISELEVDERLQVRRDELIDDEYSHYY